MQFVEGSFYHIYNRGNDQQLIFFQERNYEFFLNKVKQYVVPHANLLAWCLMPNHFHFLMQANQETQKIVKETPNKINALTEGVRIMLSSYTRAIQKQESMVEVCFSRKPNSNVPMTISHQPSTMCIKIPIEPGWLKRWKTILGHR